MYKAKIDIGGYKKGDTVPTKEAEIWKNMYKVSPVELATKDSSPAKDVDIPEDEPSDSTMHDDYLSRNGNVVIKNVEDDDLSKDDLESLLELEKADKYRKGVIKAIRSKLEQIGS